jgi:DNA invertase Pin-like site-specific DNA recombinase
MASGAKTNRLQPDRVIDQLDASDVLRVIRLDQLARRTRDLFNTLAAIADRKAGFRSLSDCMGRHHHRQTAGDIALLAPSQAH